MIIKTAMLYPYYDYPCNIQLFYLYPSRTGGHFLASVLSKIPMKENPPKAGFLSS